MRMKIARVLPVFLVLTLAFAATGCLVPVEDVDLIVEEPRAQIDLTPEELLGRVIEAHRKVDTYHFDMEMAMDRKTVARGRTIEERSLTRSYGRVDVTSMRMMASITMEMTMPPTPGVIEEVMEMYWVDGLMYANIADMPGMPPTFWIKAETPWVCSLEQTIDLLKASEIDILRVEEINGVESYLIKVTPDIDKLREFLREGILGLGAPLWLWDTNHGEMAREVSMKKWIDRDTFLVVKQELSIAQTLTRECLQAEIQSIVRFDRFTGRFGRFNEPVTIELPPEAEEAAIWGPGAAPPPPD